VTAIATATGGEHGPCHRLRGAQAEENTMNMAVGENPIRATGISQTRIGCIGCDVRAKFAPRRIERSNAALSGVC
jgi:hypothetical protein